MKKAIFTAALTGSVHTPSMSPYLPITSSQLIDEILAVHDAGGAVAHLHVRDQKTGMPNADLDTYMEVATAVKKHCDIILCTTTSGRSEEPVESRGSVVTTLKPELASLNAGSLNFALFHIASKIKEYKYDWEKFYLEASDDFIFANTFKTMRKLLEIFSFSATKPEFEIYDMGMINNLAFLIRQGLVQKPIYLQFVMGILGGVPASPENLVYLMDTARRQIGDFEFSVCAAGNGQFPMCTQSLIMGGHSRVGLEDNLYLEKGVLSKSNADQVKKIIRIAAELGVTPATPQEARKILQLKGLDQVAY